MEIKYNTEIATSTTNGKYEFSYQEDFYAYKNDQVVKLSYPAWVKDFTGATILNVYAWVTNNDSEVEKKPISFSICGANTNDVEDDPDIIQLKSKLLVENSEITFRTGQLTRYLKLTGANDYVSANSKIKITVEYIRAYIDVNDSNAYFDGADYSNLPYSPSLMATVIEKIKALENTTQVGSLFGTSLGTNDILDEDLTGQAPENYVRYERHEVKTSLGINLVMPSKGSFYRNNLEVLEYNPDAVILSRDEGVIKINGDEVDGNVWGHCIFFYTDTQSVGVSSAHVSYEHRVILTSKLAGEIIDASPTGEVTGRIIYLEGSGAGTVVTKLKYGEDYVVDSVDIPRTARSAASDAVYQNIRILKALDRDVLISYQAFGGFIASDDIRALQQDIVNTRTILTKSGILTSDSLPTQPFLLSLYKRLTKMEEFHRHYGQIEHRISIDSAKFHWINVAYIYDAAWGKPVKVYRDTGTFRVQSALRGWSYEFTVDLDISKPDASKITVRTIGTNQDAVCDFKDYSGVLFQDNLAARLCWKDDGKASGFVLQVGWDFSKYHNGVNSMTYDSKSVYTVPTDTVLVVNKSGTASMWTLYTDPEQVNYPANGSATTFEHNRYSVTADTVFSAGKTYYLRRDMYAYRRTSDVYIKEGKEYYAYNGNTGTYVEVDQSTQAYLPGNPTQSLNETIYDAAGNAIGEGPNLFERYLYNRYVSALPPVMTEQAAQDAGYMVDGEVLIPFTLEGSTIEDPSNTLELDVSGTFDADDTFTLPSGETWSHGIHKECVKIIEPIGGAIAWLGNVNITKYAKSTAPCDKLDDGTYAGETEGLYDNTSYTPHPYTSIAMFNSKLQDLIDPKSITGMTLVLFDRLYNRFVTCTGTLSPSGDDIVNGSSGGEVIVNMEDLCFCKVNITKLPITSESPYKQLIYTRSAGSVYSLGSYKWESLDRESLTDKSIAVDSLLNLSIEPFLGSMSRECDRFDLRMIRLHF